MTDREKLQIAVEALEEISKATDIERAMRVMKPPISGARIESNVTIAQTALAAIRGE